MGRLSTIDTEIAKFYAPKLFDSLKLGENKVCVWFPGSGKSTVLGDVFSSGPIMKKSLGGLCGRVVVVMGDGRIGDIKQQIKDQLGGEVVKKCKDLIGMGREVVVVIDEIEGLGRGEYLTALKTISYLVSTNSRRIHSILNIVDKPRWEKAISLCPSLTNMAQRIEYMPIIRGRVLEQYITEKANEFEAKITESNLKDMLADTGGILQLTKERLRNYQRGNSGFELKLTTIWSRLPKVYQEAILKEANSGEKIVAELKQLGVWELEVFRRNKHLLISDPFEVLADKLTPVEGEILKKFKRSGGRLIARDEIAKLLWRGQRAESYSDWALDKTISRLRVKLKEAGIDPKNIKTIKGGGYTWRRD